MVVVTRFARRDLAMFVITGSICQEILCNFEG